MANHKQYATGYDDGLEDATKFLATGLTDEALLASEFAGWWCDDIVPETEYEEGYADGVKKAFRDTE